MLSVFREEPMRQFTLIVAIILVVAGILVAQPIAPTRLIGKTWYERQSLGTLGRLTGLDSFGGVDFCWTSSASTGTPRHTFFNYVAQDGTPLADTVGVPLDVEASGAYANMSLFPDGLCGAVFHGGSMGSTHSYIYNDVLVGYGAFQGFEIPNDAQAGALISPHVALQSDAGFVAAIGMGSTGFTGMYFTRLPFNNGFGFNSWTLVDTPKVIAQDLAVSPISTRAALVWPHLIGEAPQYPDIQVDNDIYVVLSENGTTWDFDNPLNITDFVAGVPPHSDSVRAYNDLSAIFDYDGHLHVAYVVVGFWYEGGEVMTTWGSMIYHWDEYNDTHTIITGNIYAEGDPGYPNESIYCLPNLGIDPNTGNLYCTWVEFSDPGDTSSNGYLNGDIYAAGSANGGITWGAPVNLTNTSTPGASPGNALSENFSSLAPVVNDTLQVFYQVDKYAGQADFGVPATVTENPMLYMKVPTNMIPAGGSSVSEAGTVMPQRFSLAQNYPNPFNPSTNIEFSLTKPEHVSLLIYNVNGREVIRLIDESLQEGSHSVHWDAANMPSGIYFYKLTAGTYSQTKKMVLLK
jgi:hypothetical protein